MSALLIREGSLDKKAAERFKRWSERVKLYLNNSIRTDFVNLALFSCLLFLGLLSAQVDRNSSIGVGSVLALVMQSLLIASSMDSYIVKRRLLKDDII